MLNLRDFQMRNVMCNNKQLWANLCDRFNYSSLCIIALLGFAIRVDTLTTMNEGKNQRD